MVTYHYIHDMEPHLGQVRIESDLCRCPDRRVLATLNPHTQYGGASPFMENMAYK